MVHSRDQIEDIVVIPEATEHYVNYPILLAHRVSGSLLEGGASCFYDALCRYGCIRRERSLHRRSKIATRFSQPIRIAERF